MERGRSQGRQRTLGPRGTPWIAGGPQMRQRTASTILAAPPPRGPGEAPGRGGGGPRPAAAMGAEALGIARAPLRPRAFMAVGFKPAAAGGGQAAGGSL